MSQQNISVPLSATTTTLFRNWANAISGALTALGLPKTSDTGQVVLTGTTLAYPTAAQGLVQGSYAFAAYEIRQMVASGKPTIYLKVKYGIFYNTTGTGAAYYWPALSIEFGSATDGAGNLTTFDNGGNRMGICSSAQCIGSTSVNSGRPSPTAQNSTLASDGANYLSIIMGNQAPSFEAYWLMASTFERTNVPGTAAFTYDGTGLVSYNLCGAGSDNTQNVAGAAYAAGFVPYPSTFTDITNAQTYYGSTVSAQSMSYIYTPNASSSAIMYPITVGAGHGPALGVFGYDNGQLLENAQFSFSPYGASHTYIPVGRTYYFADALNHCHPAIRID